MTGHDNFKQGYIDTIPWFPSGFFLEFKMTKPIYTFIGYNL
jgi:hypothetical protein